MAIEEQLDLLKHGVREWNAWQVQHPEAQVDLSGGALRGLNLTGAYLSGADLSDADLRGTIISQANLIGAQLRGANLFKAEIDGADLDGADLRGAQFLNCGQLRVAHNWQRALRDDELACGAPIPTL